MLTNHIYDPVEIKTIECNSKPFASQCCNIELTTKKNSAPKKKQKKKTFAVLSFTYYFNRNSFLSVADSARVLIQETRLLREFASKHSVLLQQSLSHGTGAVDQRDRLTFSFQGPSKRSIRVGAIPLSAIEHFNIPAPVGHSFVLRRLRSCVAARSTRSASALILADEMRLTDRECFVSISLYITLSILICPIVFFAILFR